MRAAVALVLLGAAAGAGRAEMLTYSIDATMVGGGWEGGAAPALFRPGAPVRITLRIDTPGGPLQSGSSTPLPGSLAFEVGGTTFALSGPSVNVMHTVDHYEVPDPTAEQGRRPLHFDTILFHGTGRSPVPGAVETTGLSLKLAYYRDYPHVQPPERWLTDLARTRPEDGFASLYGYGWEQGEHKILAGFAANLTSIRGPTEHLPEPGALTLAALGAGLALLARRARRLSALAAA